MSNRAILIMVVAMIAAAGYLLFKSDAEIDMSGEKHGSEATHIEEKKEAPAAPAATSPEPSKEEKK
jgi:hypothetical protein